MSNYKFDKEEVSEISDKEIRKLNFTKKKNKTKKSNTSEKFKLFGKGRNNRPSTRDLLNGDDEDE